MVFFGTRKVLKSASPFPREKRRKSSGAATDIHMGWSLPRGPLYVRRKQMPLMGISYHWAMLLPINSCPTQSIEPCRQLRPNEASNRREFGHFDGGGTCSDAFTASPHAATMSLVNRTPVQECPILCTENRERQEYVTFRSCRALLVRFHRGLLGAHSFSLNYSIPCSRVGRRALALNNTNIKHV